MKNKINEIVKISINAIKDLDKENQNLKNELNFLQMQNKELKNQYENLLKNFNFYKCDCIKCRANKLIAKIKNEKRNPN